MPAAFGDAFLLTLISANVTLAKHAEACGIQRIGVDLETMNKAARQMGRPTRLSQHRVEDLVELSRSVQRARLFARINPLYEGTAREIDEVLAAGASYVMLPYFATAQEVDRFVRLVDGRASSIALLETASAVVRIREVVRVAGLHEVMLGLNDLRLTFNTHSHFEILCSPLAAMLAENILAAGLRFTFGGVGAADQLSLPVNPSLIMSQYPRLGATGAWISRSLVQEKTTPQAFSDSIATIRQRLTEYSRLDAQQLEDRRQQLEDQVIRIREAQLIL